jgi:hypothetical protein
VQRAGKEEATHRRGGPEGLCPSEGKGKPNLFWGLGPKPLPAVAHATTTAVVSGRRCVKTFRLALPMVSQQGILRAG